MENSLWVCMEVVSIILSIVLLQKFAILFSKTKDKQFLRNSSFVGHVAVFFSLLAFYTAFIDVPQYITRYRQDLAVGKPYLGFVEGIYDGLQCKAVNQTFSRWKGEISWLTLYFTLGLWGSNYLATNPLSLPWVKKKIVDKKLD